MVPTSCYNHLHFHFRFEMNQVAHCGIILFSTAMIFKTRISRANGKSEIEKLIWNTYKTTAELGKNDVWELVKSYEGFGTSRELN